MFVIFIKISFHLLLQSSPFFFLCLSPFRPNIAHLHTSHKTPVDNHHPHTWNAVYPTAQTPAFPARRRNVQRVPSQLIKRPPTRLPDPLPVKHNVFIQMIYNLGVTYQDQRTKNPSDPSLRQWWLVLRSWPHK